MAAGVEGNRRKGSWLAMVVVRAVQCSLLQSPDDSSDRDCSL